MYILKISKCMLKWNKIINQASPSFLFFCISSYCILQSSISKLHLSFSNFSFSSWIFFKSKNHHPWFGSTLWSWTGRSKSSKMDGWTQLFLYVTSSFTFRFLFTWDSAAVHAKRSLVSERKYRKKSAATVHFHGLNLIWKSDILDLPVPKNSAIKPLVLCSQRRP